MKKNLWGFAALPLLALLATSCGKESVESKGDLDSVLTFKAAAGKQTLSRASEAGIGDLEATGIEVCSYKDNGSGHYRTFLVNYLGSGMWGYSPSVFHPITFGLEHYSVYPTNNASIDMNQYPAAFSYTVENDYTAQEDLMVASAHTTSTAGQETAVLTYQHILSQVNFAIQGKERLLIEIDNIQVVGVKNSGTFTFGPAGSGGTWALESSTDTYAYDLIRGNATDGTNNDIFYLGNEGNGRNNGYGNALMLMPQEFMPSDGAGFTFDYTLWNMGDPDPIDERLGFFVEFGQLNITNWEQGKRYLYNIIFDPILLQFDVDVLEEWDDYNGIDGIVDVDMN